MCEVHQWADIADNFNDALIVGNGGSRAVSPSFDYANLYAYGLTHGYIDSKVEDIFNEFFPKNKPKDFERMLYRLWQADFVTQKLAGKVPQIRDAYLAVRQALIKTVKGVHPDPTTLAGLVEIGAYLRHFKRVFSLNYDLIVYWAYIAAHSAARNSVVDGFINQEFTDDIASFAASYRASTLVLYPHGNLTLYQTPATKKEKKVHREANQDLLAAISYRWRTGVIPLFVSEAKSDQKAAAIAKSPYLSVVNNDVLPDSGPSVTIYGWSMSKQDVHILRRLGSGNYTRAAVSIRPASPSAADTMAHARAELDAQASINDVVFFDAASPGCWNNP